ncbi:complement component 1 Q subcomponent-binding protein, mitochondrial isoform X2 [Bradysia coprophila]|uniref:complement component 1 Q subcomponent-binding protein, mitochondrial isoform X2 n=1 Tax=Bradysia coprophila TaxID=38358 RepID=UPI00187D992E|nr:complement component 1 Q subcomponent-binding protein, mitochondrial isoform X2 [Bradysia coprophila]
MMSNIVRSALRASTTRMFNSVGRRDYARTLWHMSKPDILPGASKLTLKNPNMTCNCGFNSLSHSTAEKDLVTFLNEEISAEKSTQKPIPTEIDGFKISLNGSDVELTKQNDKEKIKVSFNINHTVDTSDEQYEENQSDEKTVADMKSTPNFEVDIIRGGKTLSFTCSFLKGVPQEEEYDDVFGIDEVTIFEGEWKDKNYAVAGDILDGYFYDLLMNLLEDKGISNEFVTKLSTISTNYEHATYVGLLEAISKFTTGGK